MGIHNQNVFIKVMLLWTYIWNELYKIILNKNKEEHLPGGDPLLSLEASGERKESICVLFIIVLHALQECFKHQNCNSPAASVFLSQSKLSSAVMKSTEHEHWSLENIYSQRVEMDKNY